MAGQYQMTGNTAGPTPWWQLPGGGAAQSNLQNNAPAGYSYDAVKQNYIRTPSSLGQDAGTKLGMAMNGLTGAMNGSLGVTGSPAGTIGAAGGVQTTSTGAGGTGAGGAGTGTTGTPAGHIASVAAPDTSAATNAAFATAKDQAGAMSRASLTSLNDELGASGMVGSGAQVQGTRDIINTGAGQMGQVSRDLAGKTADQAADFAKMGYQGAITQRGQDIGAQEAAAQLAEQRQEAYQRLLTQMMQGLGGVGGGNQT